MLYPKTPFWPYSFFVLRLNPCLGGSNANQGFRGFNFDNEVFPSAKAVASSSIDANPIEVISSFVTFL